MPDLQNLLDQIDRLDQGASEAPWQQATDTYDGSEYKTGEVYAEAGTERMQRKFDRMDPDIRCDHGPDAEFIALARTVLPALSRAVRAVMEDCQSVENLVHKDHTYRTEYDYGMRAQARAVMEAITDVLGADDD